MEENFATVYHNNKRGSYHPIQTVNICYNMAWRLARLLCHGLARSWLVWGAGSCALGQIMSAMKDVEIKETLIIWRILREKRTSEQ